MRIIAHSVGNPKFCAEQNGHAEIIALLLAAGGNWSQDCAPPEIVNPTSPNPPCVSGATVSFSPLVNGTIAAESGGVPIPAGGAATRGATVTFTAVPDPGYAFSSWSGACVGENENPCQIAASADVTVGAAFADVDECATNTHSCAPAASGGVCQNTEGGHQCGCADGHTLSGDGGNACLPNLTVFFSPLVNGALSAESDGNPVGDGGAAGNGATVIFTAIPNAGYSFVSWSGGCAGEFRNPCRVELTADVTVGAEFADVDECATDTHSCAPAESGGVCENTEGGHQCGCADNYTASVDGGVCFANPIISFLRSSNGTVSAESGGAPIPDGGRVAHGALVIFTAAPSPGYSFSSWSGACAGESENPCRIAATMDVTVGAVYSPPCDDIAGAVFRDGVCECQRAGHIIFGARPDRYCAAPAACPAGYSGVDCVVPADAEVLPAEFADNPQSCETIFGGDLGAAGAACSGMDERDTFCLTNSATAFPCRGLFRHVWVCNRLNRSALDPFLCGAECGAANAARGAQCGQPSVPAE